MLKKTITYEDFNGEEVTEDFFFHLSKADLVELEMSHDGGLAQWLTRIVESNNGKAIIEEFKKLLLIAYGKKSEDGRRFIKSEELRQEFQSTEAYSSLFMELVTDADAAAAFVRGIVPANLDKDLAKIKGPMSPDYEGPVPTTSDDGPRPGSVTRQEAVAMGGSDLQEFLASGGIIIDS